MKYLVNREIFSVIRNDYIWVDNHVDAETINEFIGECYIKGFVDYDNLLTPEVIEEAGIRNGSVFFAWEITKVDFRRRLEEERKEVRYCDRGYLY